MDGDSASSAIDLTGTTAGLASSRPTSPSLVPSESRGSFSRRRSWGRVEAGQDPLRLRIDLADTVQASPSVPKQGETSWDPSDDPFSSPVDEDSPYTHEPPLRTSLPYHGVGSTYSTTQPGQSTASLISSEYRTFGERMEGHREDDEAGLTSNMSRPGTSQGWSHHSDMDPERSGATPRSRRKSLRYSMSPSPLKKTSTTLKTVSHNLRRASIRVVNLAGFGLDDHVRLDDVNEPVRSTEKDADEDDEDEDKAGEDALPDLSKALPIRGRTLACLGPSSRVRLAMYQFLVYPWTEPIILLLIIVNAVALTLQASRSAALPADGSENPPQITGYFHAWEDYVLFIIFCLFTLEAFARICVSGFLLDPEVPVSTVWTAFSSTRDPLAPAAAATEQNASLSRHGSLGHSHAHAERSGGLTLQQRLQWFQTALTRPFALSHKSVSLSREPTTSAGVRDTPPRRRSDTVQSKTPMMEKAQQIHTHMRNPSHPSFLSKALRSDNPEDMLSLPFRLSVSNSQGQTQRNIPYLRHSWNRIDFVAIVGFWISFFLATAGVERGRYHIGIFRALSVLRTARLLAITSGTTTIMRSLKTARPLLASVAYFVIFAMILFSIIGIQSFSGSFRRTCHLNPTLGESEIILDSQFCGAYIDPDTLQPVGYLTAEGTHGTIKGYVCPLGQICKETSPNPMDNIESFDAIYYAALQVVIVASANGWSPLMYQMMDSEFFVSCFFFIGCIVVLNFWLINLFVAVITNTFSAIRKDTKKSAFGAAPLGTTILEGNEEGWEVVEGRRGSHNRIKEVYENIRWCWVALALASLVLQATRNVDVGPIHAAVLDKGELVLTFVFDLEIVIRVLAHLPDWRSFFYRGQNVLDLVLAIGSSIIQIPAIHKSQVYPWLTIFQLMRFYRVILEIPRMKPLLLAVFGNMYGLANMSLFLILINFIAALVAVQLLRGDVQKGDFIDFGQIFNSFLAVYQVFSSENWTNVLYGAAEPEIPLRQAVIVILFVAGWMFFANFIVMQMFIAVINENFDVAEESKRSKQADHYWASHRAAKTRAPWVRRLNPYRWFKAQPKAVAVDQLPSNLVLPMQKTLIQDYSFPRKDLFSSDDASTKRPPPRQYSAKSSLRQLQRLFTGDTDINDVPLSTLKHNRRESTVAANVIDEETERHLEVLAALNTETNEAEDVTDILHERRAQKADFIRDHPTYDKPFWILPQKSPLRQVCQKLVVPAGGERIRGAAHSPVAHTIFQLILLLTVVAGIVVESIATPIYRHNYYAKNGLTRSSWFDIAEGAFCITLIVEFLIKIIADGFLFAPNAYVRSIWNVLDLCILCGVFINVTTGLVFIGGLSRVTRSLKALRALRLITLIDKMRSTFESLIISGVTRILDAALLAILYMIPYAVWGLNIFAGLMNECNDGSVQGINDCVNEYNMTLYGDSFTYVVPRVWDNPSPSTTFSFDSFKASLLILFEIVSLEGWVDVMSVATSITGAGLQPETNASQFNSFFFLIYNLLGGVVILTLFVSIIIGNFTSKTGSALLTQPQREWIDLQKLIKRQRPSKRPKQRPTWPIRAWCYDRAVHKHGWWHRFMTALFTLHIIALMSQAFGNQDILETIRNDFFILITVIYSCDTLIRLYGLGWTSYSANGWNLFDIIVAGGSLLTTLIVRFHSSGFSVEQLQKLFITSIALKLVQRMNNLNKLFKTAVASLPVILSLLSLWLILFVFFGILFVEVFSMTKWNTAETRNENYSTMPKALVMLAFMTTGEGWNQYMHDFTLTYPRCTTLPTGDSDCGSVAWAFTLFIAWNLLSMYIFVNLFTGVVVESFYYVFQMTGGSKSITREEMRAFKKVWAEFANPKTGYLERDRFVPFFGKLSGIFEVRIYPADFSVPRIMTRCKASDKDDSLWAPGIVEGFDLIKLNETLDHIDRDAIKRRKNLYNRLFHEARISCEPGKGISFTNMLLLLAHHRLIDDREALVLKDLVVRNETNKLVTDLVDFDRVQSLLLMISHRRRYLAMREQERLKQMGHSDIPAIVVETSPTTPPMMSPLMTRDITSPEHDAIRQFSELDSPPSRLQGMMQPTLDHSFTVDTPSRSSLQRNRRTSDLSTLSLDTTMRTSMDVSWANPRSAGTDDEHSDIFSAQNSIWNDMMLEAAEEEDA
ncbi:hypothetical protein OBBRIDRAFT_890152 [Obba rivulosa]|uniref:Calcium-channel protein CCH1 n=1 Tax=Obba rivulosa TaxID=1052685 RepID=A0A8E2AUI0_9APHY|nr:hypothetical protein OBBRIDRAFT_890152 [Obba rivulosa]